MGILQKLGLAKRKTHFNSTSLTRYWRAENGGDPYLRLYDEARRLTGSTDNFLKQCRFFALMQMVDHILAKGVAGDIAECGCWRGQSAWMISSRLKQSGFEGRFFIFDSFEGGLSDLTAEDRIGAGDKGARTEARQKAHFASRLDDVARALAPYPFVSLHEGWIPQVFDTVDLGDRRFALVHVDVDLYEPTRDSLAFFHPRLAEGGVIVIDDYGASGFPGAQTAVDEFRALHPPKLFLEGQVGGAVLVY